MADTGFYSQRFDSVQALRGLAAFSVILHHIIWIGNGSFGVDIFFCISGFIMMYVTEFNTKHFLTKRFIRIIPLYYFMTILTFLSLYLFPGIFKETTTNPMYLIKAFLFIPYSINGSVQPLVRVGWTLNYEMFFYVILWIAIFINRKWRAVISSGILLIIVIAGSLFDVNNTIFEFWSNPIIIEFIFGMLCYEILRRGAAEIAIGRKYLRIILMITAVSCYVFMWSSSYISIFHETERFILRGIPSMIMFLAVFIAGYNIHIPKCFVFMGNISYSVYLIHYFVIRLYDHFICPDGKADLFAVVSAIGAICLVIIMGFVSFNLFENKFNNFLRKRIRLL